MIAKTLATLTLFVTAVGSAIAETPTVLTDTFTSTKSRAEVLAELAAYKRAGVNHWSTSYDPLREFKSQKTREQVLAEYHATRDEAQALNGEDSGSAYLGSGVKSRVTGTRVGDNRSDEIRR